jgi:hypothetical protein
MSPIETTNKGAAKEAATQNRRLMSLSSEFSSAGSVVAALGSSAIPHFGHMPA